LAFLKIIHIPITINIIPATRPKSIKNKLLIKKNIVSPKQQIPMVLIK
ncbi:unnamed protein product, partial [marine sediment metagenome]